MPSSGTWVAYAERHDGKEVVIDVREEWEFADAGLLSVGNREVIAHESVCVPKESDGGQRALANLLEKAIVRIIRKLEPSPSKSGGKALQSLLTVEALAARLHVSLKTVRSWMYLRKIPFTKLGRRVYFSTDVIDELLSRNVVAAIRSRSSPGSKPTGQGGAQTRR
jgi:excisionase family DNA binding protein